MVYINNIYTGLLVFPFIAAVFTMPYAIYQYNRYGSVSKLRTLIIYSFILYMLIAFFNGQPAAAGPGVDSREQVAGSS